MSPALRAIKSGFLVRPVVTGQRLLTTQPQHFCERDEGRAQGLQEIWAGLHALESTFQGFRNQLRKVSGKVGSCTEQS